MQCLCFPVYMKICGSYYVLHFWVVVKGIFFSSVVAAIVMINIIRKYLFNKKLWNTFFSAALLQGKKNPGTDEQAVKSFLDQVMKAKEMKIDK